MKRTDDLDLRQRLGVFLGGKRRDGRGYEVRVKMFWSLVAQEVRSFYFLKDLTSTMMIMTIMSF